MDLPVTRLSCLVFVIGVPCTVAGDSAAAPYDAGAAFLARLFHLSESDVRRLDRGTVVSRSLDSTDGREVATVGMVRIAVPPVFYVRQLQNIVNFKRGEAVLQIGTFGDPPTLDDVGQLTLESQDLRRLRRCRIGNCAVQLPAEALERFQEIDWTMPDAARQGNDVMRRTLVEYVGRYREAVASGLVTYADGATSVDGNVEFQDLVNADEQVLPHFPGLRQHLLAPSSSGQPNVSELIYWSKEKIASNAVLSVTHLATWRSPGPAPIHYVAASKQIYASHYFYASLGLTLLIGDPSGVTPGTYVAYVNRSRVDAFDGIFGGVIRRVVRAKVRSTLSDYLTEIKVRLEQRFQNAPHP